MKITTYIDGNLLKKTLRESGAHSQREVLEMGLKNLLADIKRQRFIADFDKLRLNLTLTRLRQSRA